MTSDITVGNVNNNIIGGIQSQTGTEEQQNMSKDAVKRSLNDPGGSMPNGTNLQNEQMVSWPNDPTNKQDKGGDAPHTCGMIIIDRN